MAISRSLKPACSVAPKVAKGKKLAGALTPFLTSPSMPAVVKFDAIRAAALPMLMYGGEVLGMEACTRPLDSILSSLVRSTKTVLCSAGSAERAWPTAVTLLERCLTLVGWLDRSEFDGVHAQPQYVPVSAGLPYDCSGAPGSGAARGTDLTSL